MKNPEAKNENDNAIKGIELTREIARRHEQELRELINANDGANILNPIEEGSITADHLTEEFETLAEERGIDLNDFYEQAGRLSYTGHRFEATTFFQIMANHSLKKSRENKK